MMKLHYHRTSPYTAPLNVGRRWLPSLSIWGVGMGTAVVFFLSVTPIVKKGLLVKAPLLGSYYEDNTPVSDKPF